jgi:hypothetical protein
MTAPTEVLQYFPQPSATRFPSKVGCIPNAPGFTHPADRRRYLIYFAARGVPFEEAKFHKFYDALYVSLSADLSLWCRYKAEHSRDGKSPRVIFDLSDSYLVSGPVMDRLRPFYHYLSGRTSKWTMSYKGSIRRMIEASDVVVCGSKEQNMMLSPLHSEVVVMRDYFEPDLRARKSSVALVKPGQLHVLWEGFAHGNERSFRLLRDILMRVCSAEVHLHVVTDSRYCLLGGRHFCRPTFSVLEKVFAKTSVHFHMYDWNPITFSSIAAACDIALIPIPDDPIMRAKPENKILLLWSVGLPVVTTATPSYKRVMKSVGAPILACEMASEWDHAIQLLQSSEAWRTEHMLAAKAYAAKHCGHEILLEAWDHVFSKPLATI